MNLEELNSVCSSKTQQSAGDAASFSDQTGSKDLIHTQFKCLVPASYMEELEIFLMRTVYIEENKQKDRIRKDMSVF